MVGWSGQPPAAPTRFLWNRWGNSRGEQERKRCLSQESGRAHVGKTRERRRTERRVSRETGGSGEHRRTGVRRGATAPQGVSEANDEARERLSGGLQAVVDSVNPHATAAMHGIIRVVPLSQSSCIRDCGDELASECLQYSSPVARGISWRSVNLPLVIIGVRWKLCNVINRVCHW